MEWSAGKEAGPVEATVVGSFMEQAGRTPGAVAVSCANRVLTYDELRRASGALAEDLLKKHALTAGDRVGLMVERNERMIIALMGILRAGLTYVPIDPDLPAGRIRYMLNDSAARLVISDQWGGYEFTETASSDFATDVRNSDTAYIMYTSGSTGKPKGVCVSHGALADYTRTFTRYFDISDKDTIVQQSSLSFDTAVEEIFPALCSGARIHILKEGGRDIGGLLTAIRQQGITILSTTPLVISELNDLLEEPCDLRAIISGGDILRSAYVDRLLRFVPVYNTYGPTEATVCALFNRVENPDQAELLGKPIDNKKVYILDEGGLPVPVGLTGELCIAGVGLADGYLNNATETSRKFITNPFNAAERLYRTGDLGRWLPNGLIGFAGRKDTQIKWRGYRIEPAEIEKALSTLEGIEEVVVGSRERNGENLLVAWYSGSGEKGTEWLRKELAVLLPVYMIPSHFVKIGAFPLLYNGKIDRLGLAIPEESIREESGQVVEARNLMEERLAAIWSEVLGRKIGIRENFFELGGQSIKATRIIHRVLKETGRRIMLRELFAYPTVEQLAGYLQNQALSTYTAIDPAPELPCYELSHAQKRIWLFQELEEGAACYNLSWGYRMEGSVQGPALEKALQIIVSRHESLRTNFLPVNGLLSQKVNPSPDISLRVMDLREVADPETAARVIAEGEYLNPFDLTKEPLLRATLLQLDADVYIFLLTIHHIVSDAWSIDILADELVTGYNCFTNGLAPSLPVLKRQYKDYANWQQERLASGEMDSHRRYWSDQLSGELVVLPLSVKTRPIGQEYAGHRKTYLLDNEIRTSLLRVSGECQASIFTMLLAFVNVWLYKYTDENDIIVGVPVSGREHPDLEGLIGCFINILPLRTRLSGQDSIKAVIDQVKRNLSDAYEHQAYPFDSIVEDVNPIRRPGKTPFFDILVNYREGSGQKKMPDNMTGLRVTKMERTSVRSEFDLSLDFFDASGGLELTVEYNTGLFDEKQMDRMVKHYLRLLDLAFGGRDETLDSISYADAEEQKRLLAMGDGGLTSYGDWSIDGMLDELARKTPEALAVSDGIQSLTYQQLNEKANRLAHFLIDKYAIEPEDRVGLIMERSVSMIVSLLAVIRTGAAFVPLDPAYPESRIDGMVKDSGVRLVLPALAGERVQEYPGSCPGRKVKPDTLAYILYTSGSSGKPKGVQIEYGSLHSYIHQFISYFNVNGDDRVIWQSSLSFDIAMEEIFPVLCSGGRLVIVREGGMDIEALVHRINEEKVTLISVTPLILQELNAIPYKSLSSLRVMICGGDRLEWPQVNQLLGKVELYNTYGPTESTVCATYQRITSPSNVSLIGKPITNRNIYIVDKGLRLQPAGVPGEICIGGDGVARGYLNQPGLSAEKFIRDPFVMDPTARLYKTGDRGYWLDDGTIAFAGRLDHQVKVRGYRIELEEVERVILSCDAIEAVAVAVKQDPEGNKQLIACIVSSVSEAVAVLRKYLKANLPDHMIPAHIIVVDRLPMTVSGKIDRVMLPVPEQWMAPHHQRGEKPRNRMEEKILGIWREVLQKDNIGIHDNFFELGGHSLKATRLLSRIIAMTGVQVTLRDIFGNPTVAEQADVVLLTGTEARQPICPVEEQEHYALSQGQRRIWIQDQFGEERTVYNMFAVYHFAGRPDIAILGRVFEELIDRHESLRTIFLTVDGEPRQAIKKPGTTGFTITYIDVRNEPDAEQKIELLLDKEAKEPFDLGAGPLLRASLIQKDEEEYLFLFNKHHIITDGWSSEILINEVITLYNDLCAGGTGKMEPLQLQYKDFACWQNKHLGGEIFRMQREYWAGRFGGKIPALNLTTDFRRPAVRTYNGSSLQRKADPGIMEALTELGARKNATLFMVLLAALKTLLYKYTGDEDIVIGSPVSGRYYKEIEQQIGFFVNTVALRTAFSGSQTFVSLLESVRETVLRAFENQEYPFDQLLEDLDIVAERGRSPLFDVMMVYETSSGSGKKMTEMTGVSVRQLNQRTVTSKFDLTFHFIDNQPGMDLVIEYNTDLFKEASQLLFCEKLFKLLENISANPEKPIRDYDIQLEEEKRLANALPEISFNLDFPGL
jgi:amino acid adenylation domain-containing protein